MTRDYLPGSLYRKGFKMIGLTRYTLLALIAVGLSGGGCQKGQPVAEPEELRQDGFADTFSFKTLQGEWLIAGSNGEASGDAVHISDKSSYQWQTPSGTSVVVVFEPSASSPTGLVYLTFESAEDSVALGGGGPRKGIARRAANGDVEIIVSPSAGHDFPSDTADAESELTLRRP